MFRAGLLAMTLWAAPAAAASVADLDLSRIDCWHSDQAMPLTERYIKNVGIVSREDCDQACRDTQGCDLVMQYLWVDNPNQNTSCFLLSDRNCTPLAPDAPNPNPGWLYHVPGPAHTGPTKVYHFGKNRM